MNWNSKKNGSNLVLAIHGYNDYSNAFEIPGNYFSDYNIQTIAFDLRGFGRNKEKGTWFNIDFHIYDIIFNLKKLKRDNPNNKIYLLGESMGGAIISSLISKNHQLPIEGVILVAPAIWNFSETNFWKSLPLRFFSKIFPHLKVSGKGIIKVRASDNNKMLKRLSEDKLFIHEPTLRSLQGIVDLMDESFIDFKEYLKEPIYDTLILIPIRDEIVPRKPIIQILRENKIKKNINFSVYEDSFHMMLRDVNGDRVSNEIKNWIYNKNSLRNNYSFKDILDKLEKSPFYHKLD